MCFLVCVGEKLGSEFSASRLGLTTLKLSQNYSKLQFGFDLPHRAGSGSEKKNVAGLVASWCRDYNC